jgi:nitrogen regulatory protein PII
MDGLLKRKGLNSKNLGEKMKKITAYIQPFMLQKVTDALHRIHVHGMSVCDIRGCGKEKDDKYPHSTRDYVTEFTPKVKIEIICLDDNKDKIVMTIKKETQTGRKGDGKIFISDIEEALSIRTDETGDNAI